MYNNVQQYLLAGEHVLWQGSPGRWVEFNAGDILWIPLSLAWTTTIADSVVLPLFSQPFELSVSIFFFPIPLLFLAVGLYLVIGRFIHDAITRRYTSYAVTNQRLLIIRALPIRSAQMHSYDLQYLPSLELKEGRGKRGAIVFDEGTMSEWASRFQSTPPIFSEGRFHDIESPRHVYELIGRAWSRLLSQRGLTSVSAL